MSDMTIEPNQDLRDAILYMEKALNAFKKGLHMEDKPKKAAKAETKTEAPAAKAQAAEVKEEPKAEQPAPIEKDAPSIEEIRKISAQIMLDEKVGGKAIIKSALDEFKAAKISDVSPDNYLGIMQFAINAYQDRLEKMDKANADEKLQEMIEWIIPF